MAIIIMEESFKDAKKGLDKINNLKSYDVVEVTVKYKIDIEKELQDIKGNIGSALATCREGGKHSSMIKSLRAARERIDLLLAE